MHVRTKHLLELIRGYNTGALRVGKIVEGDKSGHEFRSKLTRTTQRFQFRQIFETAGDFKQTRH